MASSRVLLAALLAVASPLAAGPADRIFVNGKIWTGDDARPRAEALAVAGDLILAVGTTAEIRALARPGTAVTDLGGRLVVPGFQDSHLHFPGPSTTSVALDGLETLRAFQQGLDEFAKSHPDLGWITGGGWGYAAFPDRPRTRSTSTPWSRTGRST